MQDSAVNDRGGRVIQGSRRPDGTYRKDIRVRAGYTPQDEQPVYQSKGTLMKQGVPKVPGLDNSELAGTKAAAKSKAAKKNEKRKQKKAEEISVANVSSQLQSVRLDTKESPKQSATAPEATSSMPHTEESTSTASAAEKLLRKIRGKVRQAEALEARRRAGDQLTVPEQEKLKQLPGWKRELIDLERQTAL